MLKVAQQAFLYISSEYDRFISNEAFFRPENTKNCDFTHLEPTKTINIKDTIGLYVNDQYKSLYEEFFYIL